MKQDSFKNSTAQQQPSVRVKQLITAGNSHTSNLPTEEQQPTPPTMITLFSSWLASAARSLEPQTQQGLSLYLGLLSPNCNPKNSTTTTQPSPFSLAPQHTPSPALLHTQSPPFRLLCLLVPKSPTQGRRWLEAILLKHILATWDLISQTRLWMFQLVNW